MKKLARILSVLLAISLAAGLTPASAFAQGNGKALQMKTAPICDPSVTSHATYGDAFHPKSYIYFGNNSGSPVKWRVLDADKNNVGNDGMFLLSEYTLVSGIVFEAAWNTDDHDGQTRVNEYQHSDLQKWFASNLGNYFSAGEQSVMVGVAKTDPAEKVFVIPWYEGSRLTPADKWFPLSAMELHDYVANSDINSYHLFIAKNGENGTDQDWWLRSPFFPNLDATENPEAGYAMEYGFISASRVSDAYAIRPAFNLDRNAVLMTSAAVNGKVSQNDGTLTEIPDTDTRDWKVTILDKSRDFYIVEDSVYGKPGSTVTLTYKNATTGANEYISVLLVGSNGETHYGRVLQLSAKDGKVQVAIPELPEGSYVLRFYNEQYNGDRMTDFGSAFDDVTLYTTDKPNPGIPGEPGIPMPPQTGDGASLGLWLTLCLISFASVTLVLRSKKRRM
ncbi:MAG: hypothetical protein IKK21_03615 [Clostridia bacterium]|nr:hypothetical protein [Clostridia bacterium]